MPSNATTTHRPWMVNAPDNATVIRRMGRSAEQSGDSEGLKAVPITSSVPVYKIAIAARLRDLAREMMSIGADMDYHGGFNSELAQHGRELHGAGMIAEGWAAEIAATVDDDGEA